MFLCLLATLRMAGSLQKSTDVMKAMQQLIRLPEIRDAMMDLSKEMSKVTVVHVGGMPLRTCMTMRAVVLGVVPMPYRLGSWKRCWRTPLSRLRMTI